MDEWLTTHTIRDFKKSYKEYASHVSPSEASEEAATGRLEAEKTSDFEKHLAVHRE